LNQFKLNSQFEPTGDQPQAIEKLIAGLEAGRNRQTLLGATGTGKTFTMANVIAHTQKPTLILAHNKTLAAQLASEFQEFFPENAVRYFVSYYDYYQPEAYIPRTDTYIEKEVDINKEIEKYRNAATQSLLTRKDVVIVASVSAIYGLGNPEDYYSLTTELNINESFQRSKLLRHLTDLQYQRNDIEFTNGTYRVKGDTVDIFPSYQDELIRVEFFGDEVERITMVNHLTGEILSTPSTVRIFPAKQYVTPFEKLKDSFGKILEEMEQRVKYYENEGQLVEAQRIKQRVNYDLEMLSELGYCNGIENYSRVIEGREAGTPPSTLLDYFPDDYNLMIDESHITLPQVRGMYFGDRARKENLINFGFRLPSAFDNRPLKFDEFLRRAGKTIYVSATPTAWELQMSEEEASQVKVDVSTLKVKSIGAQITRKGEANYTNENGLRHPELDEGSRRVGTKGTNPLSPPYLAEARDFVQGEVDVQTLDSRLHGNDIVKSQLETSNHQPETETDFDQIEKDRIEKFVNKGVIEQIIRPTGLLDPLIEVRPIEGQVKDLEKEIEKRVAQNQRTLVTTMTKRMAEELSNYLLEKGVKVQYLHSDIETIERVEILRDLRLGIYDVIVGINLLREGLDLPEVSLVAILDADKEGFLRNITSLIQTIGRAARHVDGRVIMYADNMTDSMKNAIEETQRRRDIQTKYNELHGITPQSINKAIKDQLERSEKVVTEIEKEIDNYANMTFDQRKKLIGQLREEMKKSAKNLDFERAAEIRDTVVRLQNIK
jgi:excinuclease UvrABC helicase subunit UvrB